MNFSLFRRPAAFLPILMSVAAATLVIGHIAVYGIVHETDEGTPAHIFQLLMVLQVPFIGFFAINCLPSRPREASLVLVAQTVAVAAAMASVYYLEHAS